MRDNDLILIDCAPTESVLTRAAYHASRYVLVPVRLEFFSTIGFPLLRESLKNFKSDNSGHAIDVCRVLINKPPRGVDQWEARKEILEQAKKYEWTIMDNEMSYSTGYPKLMRNEYANWPGNALEEFSKIADEFMKVTRLSPQGE